MLRSRAIPAALFTLALAAVACTPAGSSSSASASASAGGGDTATTVNVTVKEFEIAPDVTTAPAGAVTFNVTNEGPDDVHEFVIIKTDLAADALPTADDGSVDEEGDGIEVIDEIEDIPVDETQDVDVTLDAGAYVLICNIVETEDGETEAHYAMGMRTAFTVE